MTNKPYFIKEHDFHKDPLGHYGLIMLDMNKIIGDIYSPIMEEFGSYNFVLLLQNFQHIMTMPRYTDASDLPIANYNAVETWNKIVRLCIEFIDRSYKNNEKLLSEAIEKSLFIIGKHQKIEFYTSPKREKGSPITEEYLINQLIYYQTLYDGQYRILISLYAFCIDMYLGKIGKNRTFDDYLNDDVSVSLNKIVSNSQTIKLQFGLDWITIGADKNVRNAVAHKNWDFSKNKVTLFTKYQWSKTFNFFEVEDLLRSLKIAIYGLQAALLISFVKRQHEIETYVVKRKYDSESIHGVLYQVAEDSGFVLESFGTNKDTLIEATLVDKLHGIGESGVILQDGPIRIVKKIPPIDKMSLRVRAFVHKSLTMLHGYELMKIKTQNFMKEDRGTISININNWIKLSENEHSKKEDYEKEISEDSLNDSR